MSFEFENILKDLNKLMIYRNLLNDNVIQHIIRVLKDYSNFNKDELEEQFYKLYSKLIIFGEKNSYTGDLWKSHIINLILVDENVFSLACEKNNMNSSKTIYKVVLQDMTVLKKLYNINFYAIFGSNIDEYIGDLKVDKYSNLKKYFDISIGVEKLTKEIINYYSIYGCGILNQYCAFRYDEKSGLVGINNLDKVSFDDLIGCEMQKETLIKNTKAFIDNLPANNVLLYGDRGTGKSSSIKAMIKEFGPKGLRLVEINRHQLDKFQNVLDLIKQRGLHFIIFMDDLSFEEFETDYKYLKSVIEGGIEARPSNVLVYATSNRRHIIKESWKDRGDGYNEINTGESIQEKLSLVDRFGVTIIFTAPNQNEYLKIVEGIAEKHNINIPMEEIKKEALKWVIWHNGRSGRTAQQFINYIEGLKNDK